MRRAITIGAVAITAALTGAGAASAVAGATTSTATPVSANAGPAAGPMEMPAFAPGVGLRDRNVLYGEAVSADKDGKKTYHVWQRGTVTSASPTSVVVRSSDGTSWTWTANDDTKVRSKGDEKKVSDVKKGDEVLVAGTRDGSVRTAARIVDPPPDPGKLRGRLKDLREDRKELRERLKDLREDLPAPEPS